MMICSASLHTCEFVVAVMPIYWHASIRYYTSDVATFLVTHILCSFHVRRAMPAYQHQRLQTACPNTVSKRGHIRIAGPKNGATKFIARNGGQPRSASVTPAPPHLKSGAKSHPAVPTTPQLSTSLCMTKHTTPWCCKQCAGPRPAAAHPPYFTWQPKAQSEPPRKPSHSAEMVFTRQRNYHRTVRAAYVVPSSRCRRTRNKQLIEAGERLNKSTV